jgi:hypothetical protein
MADEIPGGYYHELDLKGEILRAHNANGEEVEQLSEEQAKKLAEEGQPAPLKKKDDADKEADREARKAQKDAADKGKAGKR